MIDPKNCGCATLLLLMIALVIYGAVGIYRFGVVSIPILISRITQDVPTTQTELFNVDTNNFPIIVDMPKEIRPGSQFVISIRPATHKQFSNPTTIEFEIITNDLNIVRTIDPGEISITASTNDWVLPPHDITIDTVNLDNPPTDFAIKITETIIVNEDKYIFSDTITIQVDTTIIPANQMANAAISFLTFIIGTFGAVVISKLL